MKYNRRLAILITVIVVIGSVFLGGGHTLAKKYNQTEETFYSGTQGDGLSIYSDIKDRKESSYNMLTIAGRYLDAKDAAVVTVQAALSDLETAIQDKSIPALYTANDALTNGTDALYLSLNQCALSDSDKKLLSEQYTNITSSALTISRDGYNAEASALNGVLSRFPTNIIAFVNGIHTLDLFR